MRVLLGNPAAKDAYRDEHGALKNRDLKGRRVTTVQIPDGYTLLEAASAVLHPDGAWNHHSQGDAVADTTPDWVESDNEALAQLLASQFGCPVGRPASWKADA